MNVSLLQIPRLPVGLCRPLCAYLAPLPSKYSCRSHVKPSTPGLQSSRPPTSQSSGTSQTPQASGGIEMTDRYAHELQAACEAVRLAARLCTVRLCSSSLCCQPMVATQRFLSQRVQLQLKAGEKQDKSDDSPVTIADYGKRLLVLHLRQVFGTPRPCTAVCTRCSHVILQVVRRWLLTACRSRCLTPNSQWWPKRTQQTCGKKGHCFLPTSVCPFPRVHSNSCH